MNASGSLVLKELPRLRLGAPRLEHVLLGPRLGELQQRVLFRRRAGGFCASSSGVAASQHTTASERKTAEHDRRVMEVSMPLMLAFATVTNSLLLGHARAADSLVCRRTVDCRDRDVVQPEINAQLTAVMHHVIEDEGPERRNRAGARTLPARRA